MPNTPVQATGEAMAATIPATSRPIIIPARSVYPGDLMDSALDKLRTASLALSPDNNGWHDENALFSIWATLEAVIKELEPVRNSLQCAEGGAA